MKRILRFITARFIGGFLILLPLLLTYLMIGQMFDMLMVLTVPITDILPKSAFPDVWEHRLAAAAILIGLCLLAGLVMETQISKDVGHWVETRVLNRFPPYAVLRSLSRQLSGKDAPAQLQPALITIDPDTQMLAFIVEEHAEGGFTVFVPLSPTPGVGTLQIVSEAKVQRLDASMTDALGCILNWGVGAEALIGTRAAPPGKDPDSPAPRDHHG